MSNKKWGNRGKVSINDCTDDITYASKHIELDKVKGGITTFEQVLNDKLYSVNMIILDSNSKYRYYCSLFEISDLGNGRMHISETPTPLDSFKQQLTLFDMFDI